MKINLTVGVLSLVMAVVLTCGGWVVSIAVGNNEQKHIKESIVAIQSRCDKQEQKDEKNKEDISEIRQSLARIEAVLGTREGRKIGKPVELR